MLEIAAEVGLQVSSIDPGAAASTTPMVTGMNQWVSGPCLFSEPLSSLRKVMGVTGARSAGRDLSAEEWEAISLYMCAVWTKVAPC